MRDYLFGLATLPSAALAYAIGYWVIKGLAKWGARKMRGLPLGPASSRAAFAAACASSRRVYTVSFSGFSLVLTAGFSTENYEAVRKAVYRVLVPPPVVNPKWKRTPTDPGLDFSNDGDDQPLTDSETNPTGGDSRG